MPTTAWDPPLQYSQVGVVAHTQAAQGPIVPVGGLHVLDLPTSMARAQEVLLAVFHPLDGPRQLPREGGEDGLGIRVDLTAEAAADIHRDDPQLVLREAEDVDHRAPFQMGAWVESHKVRSVPRS